MLLPLLTARESSLDAQVGDLPPAMDRVPATGPSPEEEAYDHEREALAHDAVHDAIAGLSEREQLIVTERLMAEDPLTLQTLGDRLGVSKERVRQIEERACNKLRQRLEELRPVA